MVLLNQIIENLILNLIIEENKNKVDDYYMMKEILIRRFKNIKFKEEIDLHLIYF